MPVLLMTVHPIYVHQMITVSARSAKKFQTNVNKCHLLTSSTVRKNIKASNLTVKSENWVKLLGININNRLSLSNRLTYQLTL